MQLTLMLLPLLLILAYAAAAQEPAVKGVSATVAGPVLLAPEAAFRRLVPIPLEQIFQAGYGLPAITGTSVVTPWDAVGQSRRVFFATGDSARETITDYRPGEYFAYRVDEFTIAAKYVARCAVGQWWWREENGQTVVTWRYTFVPKSFLARPLLALFVRFRWRPYMRAALTRVQQDAAAQTTHAR